MVTESDILSRQNMWLTGFEPATPRMESNHSATELIIVYNVYI